MFLGRIRPRSPATGRTGITHALNTGNCSPRDVVVNGDDATIWPDSGARVGATHFHIFLLLQLVNRQKGVGTVVFASWLAVTASGYRRVDSRWRCGSHFRGRAYPLWKGSFRSEGAPVRGDRRSQAASAHGKAPTIGFSFSTGLPLVNLGDHGLDSARVSPHSPATIGESRRGIGTKIIR